MLTYVNMFLHVLTCLNMNVYIIPNIYHVFIDKCTFILPSKLTLLCNILGLNTMYFICIYRTNDLQFTQEKPDWV